MKNRLVALLNNLPDRSEIIDGVLVGKKVHTAETIAEYLIANGVIAPPCKVGDTAYAAINPIFDGDEAPFVNEWIIKGIAHEGNDTFFLESEDDEWYEIGEQLCKLTREETEKELEKKYTEVGG